MPKSYFAANGIVYFVERCRRAGPDGGYAVRFARENGERWRMLFAGKVWREGLQWFYQESRKQPYWEPHSTRREAIDALAETVAGTDPKHKSPWVVWEKSAREMNMPSDGSV